VKLAPLYHNILVDPMKEGDITPGGLIVPAIATKKSPFAYGVVIATGDGRINGEGKIIPLAVKAGDVVMYVRNTATEVPVETDVGEKLYAIIIESNIVGKVTGLSQKTSIMGVDGRLLQMAPLSRTVTEAGGGAAPDVVYQNIEATDQAIRAGWDDAKAYEDEP